MTKHITGFIVGLVFYRFLPQYALVACIVAAIVLAIFLEEKHRFLKMWKGKRRKTLPKQPKRQRRLKQV